MLKVVFTKNSSSETDFLFFCVKSLLIFPSIQIVALSVTLAFFHKGQVASLSIGSSSKTSSRGLLTQDHVKDADLELILKNKDQNNEMANKPKSKRKYSYVGLGCRGMFHQIFFSKLENLCDQCYEMYKIPEIHHLCR